MSNNCIFNSDFDFINDEALTLRIIQKYNGDKKMLPFYYWEILFKDIQIGKISLRIGSNFHSYYNGNIGYEINKIYRGNHYAYKACLMILPVAKAHGMEEVILTCDESNIASYKTIEKLGAEMIEIAIIPKTYFAWHKNMKKQRIYKLKL